MNASRFVHIDETQKTLRRRRRRRRLGCRRICQQWITLFIFNVSSIIIQLKQF